MDAVIGLVGLAVFVAAAVFVHKDAKELGATSPGTWAMFAFLAPHVTVPIWLYTRSALKHGRKPDFRWALSVLGLLVGYGVPIALSIALFGPGNGLMFFLAITILFAIPISIYWVRH